LQKSLPEIHCRYGCRLTAATLGQDGVLAWDGKQFHYASAFQIEAVDTTGAGDIFHAGFIYALLQGWPLQKQLDFACAAAALNCTAVGARGGIAPVTAIERLMSTGARHPSAFAPPKPRSSAFLTIRDPRLFYIHSRWVDEAAFQVHAELPHTVRFLQRVDALLDQPRDVTRPQLLG